MEALHSTRKPGVTVSPAVNASCQHDPKGRWTRRETLLQVQDNRMTEAAHFHSAGGHYLVYVCVCALLLMACPSIDIASGKRMPGPARGNEIGPNEKKGRA